MDELEFYRNALSKLKEFYRAQYTVDNAEKLLFEILNKIIPFDGGTIYLQNSDSFEIKYQHGNKDTAAKLQEPLAIQECKFGMIEIGRYKAFSDCEADVFKTCAVIISGIIKDIELSSIVRLQVEALQEGIKEAKKQEKKLKKSEKVKTRFLANMSHELRSPLNSILGFSELLEMPFTGSLNEKQKEYVSDIRIASLHLLGMVNEVLDISKIEAHGMTLNLTQFNLRQNAAEVLNILKPLYEKKKLKTELDIPENIEITADYQKFQQIFFNLVSNAIKFTPSGGKITIKTETASKNLTIKIIDTGAGIEKKHLKKIFKKFVQINPNSSHAPSTGLGLTITRELVLMHGGKIYAESEPSKGTKFIIELQNVVI